MAGYSGTPLAQKLGIKPGHTLFLDNAPDELELGDLDGVTVVRRLPRQADISLTFHTTMASLERRLAGLFDRTETAGMVWVCWPKKSAQKALGITSDLDENLIRDYGLELGFVDVKVGAVDDTWSGLKFVRRLKDR